MDKALLARRMAPVLKARVQQNDRGNGYAPTTSGYSTVQPNPAFSPVVSSYHEWISGFGYGKVLPRPLEDFLSGAFGPMSPIQPFSIDQPDEDSGRPRPRRWQYPVGTNLPQFPGDLKLVSFANLRAYGDLYSVARVAAQVRKQEICGLDIDVVPTDEAAEAMKKDKSALKDFKERRNIALQFWKRPDPNYINFKNWLMALLEDIFIIDALSLYQHPTRQTGKGPFGSDMAALELLDGSTIRPIVDMYGASPRPPAPAYQQYIYGVPRVDLMTMILDSDQDRLDELGEPQAAYQGDQLMYIPYTARSWTTYGFSCLEQAILPTAIGLKRQQWQYDFFSEGSIPAIYAIAPEGWTAHQIRQLQDALNAIGGDTAMKHRILVLPGGTKTELMKPPELADKMDSQLMEAVLMAFDVKPMELGLAPGGRSTGMGGGGAAMQAQAEAGSRHSFMPMVTFLQDCIFNYIMHNKWHQDDMQMKFVGLEEEEDQQKIAEVNKTYVSAGIKTIDEVRTDIELEPFGLDQTSEPLVLTGTGYVPVALAGAGMASGGDGGDGGDGNGGSSGASQLPPGGKPPVSGVNPEESTSQPAQSAVNEPEKTSPSPQPAQESQAHSSQKAASPVGNDLGSTQVDLPPEIAAKVLAFGRRLPASVLTGNGVEEHPHVTVRYGLDKLSAEDIEALRGALATMPPFLVTVGATDFFSSPVFDVIYLEAESEGLVSLRSTVESVLDLPPADRFYTPHITVAYILPGLGLGYKGMNQLEGMDFVVNSLTVTSPGGVQIVLPLGRDSSISLLDKEGEVGFSMTSPLASGFVPFDLGVAEKPKPKPKKEDEEKITAKSELSQLKNYLRHHSDASKFLAKTSLVRQAVRRGGDVAWASRMLKVAEDRADVAKRLIANVESKILSLSEQIASGGLTQHEFVDQAQAVLDDAYRQAMLAGALSEFTDFAQTDTQIQIASQYSAEQRQFLSDLANDIGDAGDDLEDGDEPQSLFAGTFLGLRLGMYASTIYARYEQGRLDGWKAANPAVTVKITWNTAGDEAVCSLCDEKDGQDFSEDDLPGFPGDGNFGEICEGAMNCRCFLTYEKGESTAAAVPDISKFDPDPERDDHGRFASSGIESSEENPAESKPEDFSKTAKPLTSSELTTMSDSYKATLSPGETEAVRWYTSDYGFKTSNGILRGQSYQEIFNNDKQYIYGAVQTVETQAQKVPDTVKALDAAPPLDKDIVVYRGMAPGQIEKMGEAKTFEDKGFVSTTVSRAFADSWSWRKGAQGNVMEIVIPKGTRAIPISSISREPAEKEMVLPRGGSFEKITLRGRDAWVFRAPKEPVPLKMPDPLPKPSRGRK